MAKFAREVSGYVIELFTEPDGITIDMCFTPEVLEGFHEVPDGLDVQVYWTWDGTTFHPPAEGEVFEPAP